MTVTHQDPCPTHKQIRTASGWHRLPAHPPTQPPTWRVLHLCIPVPVLLHIAPLAVAADGPAAFLGLLASSHGGSQQPAA